MHSAVAIRLVNRSQKTRPTNDRVGILQEVASSPSVNSVAANRLNGLFSPGIDNNLGHALFFVTPHLVHFWSLIERNAMRNDVTRIDLPLFDALQKRLH